MRLKIVLILFIMFYSANCLAVLPKAKLTVKVVNTQDEVIAGAYVYARFTTSGSKGVRGETDTNGMFTATSETVDNCGITIKKDGYYVGGFHYDEHNLTLKKHLLTKRWEPWGKVETVILKDIRNPTPMYAKDTYWIKVPELNKKVGYDLEKGDWVAPYGTGIIEDFIFIFNARNDAIKDWECSYKLIFSNKKDGIQEYYPDKNDHTEYIWPYKAPETGYKNEINRFKKYTPDDNYSTDYNRKNRNYIFRVRTKLDSKGNIIEAKYGKIKGEILLTRRGKLSFIYYFNPTGNRNLEYDKKNPLFKFPREKEVHKVSDP